MSINTVIATNIPSLDIVRKLGKSNKELSTHSKKLSSGLKINSASDDAAGLTISQKMKSQIYGLNMAQKNVEDSTEVLEIIDGALAEMNDIYIHCRELAIQAANDTNSVEDQRKIAAEMLESLKEINTMYENTEFNGNNVFELFNMYYFQVGANSAQTVKFKDNYSSLEDLMTIFDEEAYAEFMKFLTEVVKEAFNNLLATDPYEIGNTCTIYGVETALVDYAPWLNTILSEVENMREVGTSEVQQLISAMQEEIENVITKVRNETEEIFIQRMSSDASNEASPNLWLGNASGEGSIISEDKITPENTRPTSDSVRVNTSHVLEAIQNKDKIVAIDSNFDDLLNSLQEIFDKYTDIFKDKGLFSENLFKELEYFVGKVSVITTEKFGTSYINIFDKCIAYTSEKRAHLGATINRLDYNLNSLKISEENLYSANSYIEDANMAKEIINLTKQNILINASMALLAQSNSSKENILQLLS